jgi:hypothetical protein
MASSATAYENPLDIVKDKALSHEEKTGKLNTWEQDARQLMTASNEGMPSPEEGLESRDHHRLGKVVRAKATRKTQSQAIPLARSSRGR